MKTQTQHTPGPWTVGDQYPAPYGSEECFQIELRGTTWPDGSTPLLAVVVNENVSDSTTQANARLIAAAPDLLEALKAILGGSEYRESQSEIRQLDGESYEDAERRAKIDSVKQARAAITRAEGRE